MIQVVRVVTLEVAQVTTEQNVALGKSGWPQCCSLLQT